MFKGRIWLESKVSEGSRFFFSLPYSAPVKSTVPFVKARKINQPIPAGTAVSILVVEDDEPSYILIKEYLEGTNIEAHHVTNGVDAINFVKENPGISLILMDMKLPKMDGYEAAGVIREMNPKIPIIAQTSYAMVGDREKAISAGCDYYLTKPLDFNKLMEILKIYILRPD